MLVDSHSHLHFPVYSDDIENVLFRMKEKDVVTLTVGTSYQNSLEAVEFSEKYSIPCSVGFHPSHARPSGVAGYFDPTEEVYGEEFDVGKFRTLLKHNSPVNVHWDVYASLTLKDGEKRGFPPLKIRGGEGGVMILAIGECGLDYFRLPEDDTLKKQFKYKQREAFEAQIQLAQEFKLPLIIHTRASKEDSTDAYRDTLEILTTNHYPLSTTGVMHCYLGNVEYTKKFLDLGLYLSFSGIVTFKNADLVRESARYCPLDRILSETDCPYLAPEPYRGKQNEPSYVEFVVRKLEELKNVSLAKDIVQNFERLFLANF